MASYGYRRPARVAFSDLHLIPLLKSTIGVAFSLETQGFVLHRMMELLMCRIALLYAFTIPPMLPFILIDNFLAAAAIASECHQDLQPVLIDDVNAPFGIVAVNGILQRLQHDPGHHADLFELIRQLPGSWLHRQTQPLPHRRKLDDQVCNGFQICLFIRVFTQPEAFLHQLTYTP